MNKEFNAKTLRPEGAEKLNFFKLLGGFAALRLCVEFPSDHFNNNTTH
jgi:hypothetical protein